MKNVLVALVAVTLLALQLLVLGTFFRHAGSENHCSMLAPQGAGCDALD